MNVNHKIAIALSIMSLTTISAFAKDDVGITDGCNKEPLVMDFKRNKPSYMPCFPLPIKPTLFFEEVDLTKDPGYAVGYFEGKRDQAHGIYDREKQIPAAQDKWSQARALGYARAGEDVPQDGNTNFKFKSGQDASLDNAYTFKLN